jgi:methyl-accepting chemotaxis protein
MPLRRTEPGGEPLMPFLTSKNTKARELEQLREELTALRERAELLDTSCGVGLWQAVLYNEDAFDPRSVWTWSPEFRRLLGYSSEADFPNVYQSWADKLHPDDAAPTRTAFKAILSDKTGATRYDVTYRLMTKLGSYRWFQATGGCRHSVDGRTIRACGSLSDIHEQKSLSLNAAQGAAEDKATTAALGAALKALANGDLSFRITEKFPVKYEALKASFNESTESLGRALRGIRQAAFEVSRGAGEIEAGNQNLSQRTEQQASSLEETASSMDQMTGTVRQNAGNAEQANQLAVAARSQADTGVAVVATAIKAMGEINDSSKKIGDIIGVVEEIAFQTNLLALNAAVEAARAGDQGRGFAVVAGEVRSLAGRSAVAAKEIKGLIRDSMQKVEEGASLVSESGQTLERIVTSVKKVSDIIAELAAGSQEQLSGIEQVNRAVTQLDQMTQQNAALVEEASAASKNMASRSQAMSDMLDRYKLGDEQSSRAMAAITRQVA